MDGILENLKLEYVLSVKALTGTRKRKSNFYVYIYLDPRKPGTYKYKEHTFNYEPIYVGKGTGKRVYFYKGHNVLFQNKLIKFRKPIICIIKNLTEREAHKIEKYFISTIGRHDLGTGSLCNFTDGGEGVAGRIVSEELRKRMSESSKGKIMSAEARKKMSESKRNMSEDTKKKMSESAKKRKPVSEETREKLSRASKQRERTEEWKRKISNGVKVNWKERKLNYQQRRSDHVIHT